MATQIPSNYTDVSPYEYVHGRLYTLVVDNMDTIIGACLAIVGNLLISIAMNVQKYSLTCLKRQEEEEDQTQEDPPEDSNWSSSFFQQHNYLKSRLWWCGIILMVLGEVGNFMAYGFAPASVVAPLGTTTVVANTYIAVFFLGEQFRCQDALGTAVIVVGAFLIVMFSSHNEVRLSAAEILSHLSNWPFLIYMGTEVLLFVLANFLLFWRNVIHVVLFILPAALLASATVIAAKAVAGMITLTLLGENQLEFLTFYVMIIVIPVTGVLQIRYVTQAMHHFNATVVVPTFFVFFTLSAILAGIFFYNEFNGLTFTQITVFIFGCLFCFLGVFFISSGRTDPNEESGTPTQALLPKETELRECPFPCYGMIVQPASDEEELIHDESGTEVEVVQKQELPNAQESLFNPDQPMASDIPNTPPARRMQLLAPNFPGDKRDSVDVNGSAYSTDTNMARALSWDSSYDPRCLELQQEKNGENRTHKRAPSRNVNDSRRESRASGSSSSSSS